MLRKQNKFLLEHFVVGPMEVNCYLLADPSTGEACVIDPGADPSIIKDALKKNGLKLKFIINTHGHGDHIAANGNMKAPIYIHRLDKDFLSDPSKNLSKHFIFSVVSPEADRLLEDGDKIALGELTLKIIHTPGHTPGSISIKVGDVIFTGDTLFCNAVGRTDLAHGNEKALYDSIEKKLLIFDDDTIIYPGHGPSSTIGNEKKNLI